MKRLRLWLPVAIALVVVLAGLLFANSSGGDGADANPAATTATATRQSTRTPTASTGSASSQAPRRDLAADEAAGGHTLERHVGRTDEQLRQRLRDEPDISAASTYTDRDTAERVVGAALQRNQAKIADWVKQGRTRANLALDYEAGEVIGRSIPRGKTVAHTVTAATVVLRADGSSWFVLTSYPDD